MDALDSIEETIRAKLARCDEVAGFNQLKALRILRSLGAATLLVTEIGYRSLPDFDERWGSEIEKNTIDILLRATSSRRISTQGISPRRDAEIHQDGRFELLEIGDA